MSDPARRASEIQDAAAQPDQSVALRAAAGSGKTKVLVDRFLRLCLAGEGVDPRAVLAITFTRKATVEITARLQRRARELARLAGADLDDALHDVLGGESRPAERERVRAAWFHESLLDDPGGLGIATLHSFCQKVLGRFAADAGLDPRFTVLDERQEREYQRAALDRLELELGRDPERAVAYVRLTGTTAGARDRIAGLLARRMHLQRWLARVAPLTGPPALAMDRRLADHADALAADLQRAALQGTPWQDVARPEPADLAGPLAAALDVFAESGLDGVRAVDEPLGFTKGFTDFADSLATTAVMASRALACDPTAVGAVAAQLREAFLTQAGKLRQFTGRKGTKTERQQAFAAAAAPVLRLVLLPDLLALLARNRELLAFALRALDLYSELKRRDRVLDFQDLEDLALRLLTDPETGPQVHYRLDARLDHVLLDEFQDTNRNQWELLEPLLVELLAGGDPPRTVFVVGDVKQSIYGFRGAEPDVFRLATDLIERQAGPDALKQLPTNFRSLAEVVDVIGDIFTHEPLRGHLGAEAASARQEAARPTGGVVRFVEPFRPADDHSGHERAAEAVVALVGHLLDPASAVATTDRGASSSRPLRHDDIAVLARNKTHLAVYEAALRRAGIPYTPAGRGLLARCREVQDVLALLRWLTYPADDTAGATVLRSPCFRLPESTVQHLLQRRLGPPRRNLRDVLPGAAGADPALAPVAARIDGWFRHAGLLPLHDLLRRVFREGDLLARFELAGGEQARYNLLRLLDLALAGDRRGGSLRDFVDELEQADRLGGEEEGALPGEAGGGRVRVMTVHGAKGLEAPVVLLVDAAVPLNETTEHLLLGRGDGDGPWLDGAPRALTEGIDDGAGGRLAGPLAAARDRALARLRGEEAHVLYVALTRARDRLYVLGGANRNQAAGTHPDSYLGWLQAAAPPELWLRPDHLPADMGAPAGPGGDPLAVRADRAGARHTAWSPPRLAPRREIINPSRLAGDRENDPSDGPPDATARPSDLARRETAATARGTRIHRWLERACDTGSLPPPPRDAGSRAEWNEARAVFAAEDLRWIVAPEAQGGRGLSEVTIVYRLDPADPTRRLLGVIDRLVVRPGRVDIVDYKSNRVEPGEIADLVEHYREQLRAYRDALRPLYPDRDIRCWLLWTRLAAAGHPAALTEVTP